MLGMLDGLNHIISALMDGRGGGGIGWDTACDWHAIYTLLKLWLIHLY
jgi:hypothetical protein